MNFNLTKRALAVFLLGTCFMAATGLAPFRSTQALLRYDKPCVQTLIDFLSRHWKEPAVPTDWDISSELRKMEFPFGYKPYSGSFERDFNQNIYLVLVSESDPERPMLVLHKNLERIEIISAPIYAHLPDWKLPVLATHILKNESGHTLYIQVYPSPSRLKLLGSVNPQPFMLGSFGFRKDKIPLGWHATLREGTHESIDAINEPHLDSHVKQWINGKFGEDFPLELYWEYTQSYDFSTKLRYTNVFHDYMHYLFFTKIVGKENRALFYKLVLKYFNLLQQLLQNQIEGLDLFSLDPYQNPKQAQLISEIFARLMALFYEEALFPNREKIDFSRNFAWDQSKKLPAELYLFALRLQLFDKQSVKVSGKRLSQLQPLISKSTLPPPLGTYHRFQTASPFYNSLNTSI